MIEKASITIERMAEEIKCLRKEKGIYEEALESITSRADGGNTDEEILMTQLAWSALEKVKQGFFNLFINEGEKL